MYCNSLFQQLTQCSNRLTKAFYTIRGATFGMDRFHRRYWVLPKCGGVFVESMESSLKPEEQEQVFNCSKKIGDAEENEKDRESNREKDSSTPKETKPSLEEKNKIIKYEDQVQETCEIKNDKDIKEELASDQKKEAEKDATKDESDSTKMEVDEIEVKKEADEDSNKKEMSDVKINETKEPEKISESEKDILENLIVEKENNSEKHIPDPKLSIKSNIEIKDSEQKLPATLSNLISNKNIESNTAENDKESKNISPSPKKIWTIDGKSSEDNILKNVKKENDLKIKKEEKKDNKGKDSENKFIEKMFSVKDEKKQNVNIFMPNLCDNSINLDLGAKLLNSSERHNTPNPSIPPDQNWVLHSPLFASILAGNMLFNGPLMSQRDMNGTYFNLPKNDSNNPFGPFLGLQPNALSEQIFKSFGEKPNSQKPWFSILPRMPCDESLITSPQPSRSSSTVHSPHSPDVRSSSRVAHPSQNPNAPPGHVASALSNLQMELMNGVPPGFFLHPFLPPQFGGPTYQSTPSSTCSSHHSSFTTTMSHSPMPDFGLNFNRPPAASTPNSIPTPSATPGPTSHGYATPTSRDSPSPSFTKRLMMEKMTQEYEAPQPISPGEFTESVSGLYS